MANNIKEIQAIDLSKVVISREALGLVPAAQARRYGILPIAVKGQDVLQVVLNDPDDRAGVAQLEARIAMAVEVLPCIGQDSVKHALARYYPKTSQAAGTPLATLEEVVNRALQMHCSDIHLDPDESMGYVRMRIDGLMRVMREMPLAELSEVVSAIKVASELDIAERRVPQDGQMSLESLGEKISMRVATIPTIYGEKVTLRILETAAAAEGLANIDNLGMSDEHYRLFLNSLNHSHGVILLCGPTGSGKTTTLYAALRHLRLPQTHHILTIEDPVEIPLSGINQVHIDSDRVSFNKALRSTLRHDPDIIMIGEIRDFETADIAVKSALTGHLVLSTLHANDSIGVVMRLLNLEVSAELVTSALRLVIAQRLVRRPCRYCFEWSVADEEMIEEFNWQDIENPKVPVAKGCEFCSHSGYSGRIAIYEMIPIGRAVREMILQNASHDEIISYVFNQQKNATLLRDGSEKILKGLTTPEEVRRATYLGEDK